MKVLIQLTRGNICAGLIVDHNKVVQTAPVLRELFHSEESWPVARARILSQDWSVWEKMIDTLGDPPHGAYRKIMKWKARHA